MSVAIKGQRDWRKEGHCPRYLVCGRPGTKDIDVILLSSNDVQHIYIPFIKETDRQMKTRLACFIGQCPFLNLRSIWSTVSVLLLSRWIHRWSCCGSLPVFTTHCFRVIFAVRKRYGEQGFASAGHCCIILSSSARPSRWRWYTRRKFK